MLTCFTIQSRQAGQTFINNLSKNIFVVDGHLFFSSFQWIVTSAGFDQSNHALKILHVLKIAGRQISLLGSTQKCARSTNRNKISEMCESWCLDDLESSKFVDRGSPALQLVRPKTQRPSWGLQIKAGVLGIGSTLVLSGLSSFLSQSLWLWLSGCGSLALALCPSDFSSDSSGSLAVALWLWLSVQVISQVIPLALCLWFSGSGFLALSLSK